MPTYQHQSVQLRAPTPRFADEDQWIDRCIALVEAAPSEAEYIVAPDNRVPVPGTDRWLMPGEAVDPKPWHGVDGRAAHEHMETLRRRCQTLRLSDWR